MNPVKKILKPILSRPSVARAACRWLLRLDNQVDRFINELLPYAEAGVHPKHRLMNYHRFFLEQVGPSDRVLDVGCGRGIVAESVSHKARHVTGIDLSAKNVAWARSKYDRPNLSFVEGDACRDIPAGQFDVIILSNVLEHIEARTTFLKKLIQVAPRLLIRVPLITRDWMALYKKEVGVDYRMDDTHYIEYTDEGFRAELVEAGLRAVSAETRFGEIWAVVEKAASASPAAGQVLSS